MKASTGIILMFMAASIAWGDTYVSRIDEAVAIGNITADQAVFFYAWSVLDESRLPSWVTSGAEAGPCGTPAMDAVTQMLDELSPAVRGEILNLLARPSVGSPEYTYDTPGGHFKIHWTDAGTNATTLEWVTTVGMGMDSSWAHEVDTMDWDAPPSDLGLGGDTRFDVYMLALSGGTIGWCSSSGEPSDPTTPEADYSSHIAMSNAESWGENQILETCSHEFQHALQNGYEAAEPSWFKENCATWMQNECWTTNLYVDYLHSGENCLRRPWYDIRSGSMYYYGATPWPMYIQTRCGGQEAVRMVWENAAATVGANMLEAITETAEHYGMTFNDWLAEYTCWRWFTGSQADASHYPQGEASLWTPGPYIFSYHNVSSLPWTGDEGVYAPDTYGNHWIKIPVSGYQGWITVDFDGRDNVDWIIGVIQTASDGTDAFTWHTVTEASATLELGVGTTGWQYVVLFVQPLTDSGIDFTYDISVEAQSGVEGGSEAPSAVLSPSSNPMAPGGSFELVVPAGGFTTLGIYDLSGRLVETLVSGVLEAGSHTVGWNAEGLSTGAYFARLNVPGSGVTERVILSR